MNSGYTIFVIRTTYNKNLPDPDKGTFDRQMPREGQMYIPAKDIETFHNNNKNHKLNVSGQDERELEAALQKSLK